ncbi:MAG: sugar ABC transporter substrate-binding protein [Mycobacteriales bacterium]
MAVSGGLILSLALAACGDDGDDAATKTSPPVVASSAASASAPASGPTATQPAVASSTAAAQIKPVTILAQTYYTDEPSHSLWSERLTKCGAPHQITVKHESVPGGELIPKILQQGQAKTLPDLIMVDNPEVQQVAAAGVLLPLEDFGIKPEGILEQVTKASTYEGKLYGAQPDTNTLAVFYNVDTLAKAGVTPPKTWDELKAASAKLSGNGNYGIAFSAKADFEGTWQFLPFFWSAGAELDAIDSPEAVSALTLLKDLVDSKSASKSVVNWGQSDVLDQFTSGKAAMMINGPWNFPALKTASKEKGLKWDVATVPVAKNGAPSGAPLGGEAYAIGKTGNADKEQAAAKVIDCLMSDEMQLEIAKNHGLIPTRESVLDAFAGSAEPQMKGFVEQIKTARARTGVVGIKYPEVGAAIHQAMGAALVGGKTPQEALAAAAASVK